MNYLLDIVNSEVFVMIQTLFVIIVGSLCLIVLIYKTFQSRIKNFIKKHIVDEFHGPDMCFDCSRTTCDHCEIWKEKK
jgi:hypothetical protein